MLLRNCKAKIKKVSADFAIALMSARLEQTVCYSLGGCIYLQLVKVSAYIETNFGFILFVLINLLPCYQKSLK
jgi:hypothetical protein